MNFTEDDIRAIVKDEIEAFFKNAPQASLADAQQPLNQRPTADRTIHEKHLQILDARNIQLGRTNGTMIGTASDQKLGFYGATPVAQQAAIPAPSGAGSAGVDSSARTAINTIIAVLKNAGITK